MAASLLLLVAGVVGELMGMDAHWLLLSTGETLEVNAPLLLLAAGLLGCATTLGRCAMFAWCSDLRGLPAIGRGSRRQSHHVYRALIAWLHLVQPVARFRGNLRGLSLSQGVASQHVTRHPWKAPVPALRDARAAARLLTGGRTERSFWGESYTSHTTLLTELVGVLRAARPAQVVHVDEGWRADRDLSLTIGRWGWLHVQTLVEDHERGSCLFRARARLRPSFVGTVQGLTAALLLAGGTSASMALHGHSASMVVSVIAITGIVARAAWQATRAVAAVDRALARVATAAGMLPLPLPLAPLVSRSAETLSETTLSRG
jgi:hypothetical protein